MRTHTNVPFLKPWDFDDNEGDDSLENLFHSRAEEETILGLGFLRRHRRREEEMVRSRSSSSSWGPWRVLHPAYYLKRPRRLGILFVVFVLAYFAFWDRQTLVREHEVRPDPIGSLLAIACRFVSDLLSSWCD